MNKQHRVKSDYTLPAGAINAMIDDYLKKCKLLNHADKEVQDPNSKEVLYPLMYAFYVGQLSIYEIILHNTLDLLTDEELYQSKLFKETKPEDKHD